MAKKRISLWRLNRITGIWDHQRVCADDTAQAWLTIFKSQDPTGQFKLSRSRPK